MLMNLTDLKAGFFETPVGDFVAPLLREDRSGAASTVFRIGWLFCSLSFVLTTIHAEPVILLPQIRDNQVNMGDDFRPATRNQIDRTMPACAPDFDRESREFPESAGKYSAS